MAAAAATAAAESAAALPPWQRASRAFKRLAIMRYWHSLVRSKAPLEEWLTEVVLAAPEFGGDALVTLREDEALQMNNEELAHRRSMRRMHPKMNEVCGFTSRANQRTGLDELLTPTVAPTPTRNCLSPLASLPPSSTLARHLTLTPRTYAQVAPAPIGLPGGIAVSLSARSLPSPSRDSPVSMR